MAGFPSENAGIDATPLVLMLTFASAFSFVFKLYAVSCEKEIVKMKISSKEQNDRISGL